MSTSLSSDGSPLLADVSRRWQAVDPLLPAPAMPEPDRLCGGVFTVPGADGRPIAVGGCEHWHGDAESLELSWGASRRFQLTAWVGGAEAGVALDQLLQLWCAHLAALTGVDDPDSAAVVVWPSREIDGIRTLLRHGFAPRSVIAARRARPASHAQAPPTRPGFDIRRAGPADVDAVTRLGLEVIRYDAHFGGVVERASTAAALRAEMAAMLAVPEPWIWLAERDRSSVGVLIGEQPPVQWIAPLVGVGPVAYNMLTFVSPADRGSGVAAALVGCFHEASQAAGVPTTLLHYEQTNPLSAPFWAQHGYRPLWTSWDARPACTMR